MGGGYVKTILPSIDFHIAIISSKKDFYRRMKFLENSGVPGKDIIDGRVFQTHGFDFPRFLDEGIAYGFFDKIFPKDVSATIYPRIYESVEKKLLVKMGIKSYVDNNLEIETGRKYVNSEVKIGNFCSIAANNMFQMGTNMSHNYHNVTHYQLNFIDWKVQKNFFPPYNDNVRINIGNDVWIGRGCKLKCSNPEKPLTIGDGAVIASDSVVVKNVPPYAIVGGNPAKIIKYRFPEKIIEALLRIKWWEWDLDKIHDNFKYFNDIEKFVELHDKGV